LIAAFVINCEILAAARAWTWAARARYCLIRKSSFFNFVPFISSRIQTGVMPRPDHFSDLFLFDWYFGFAFARLPVLPLPRVTALAAADAFFDT
jgi:hypothetical protein